MGTLEQNFTINGQVVEHNRQKIGKYDIYTADGDGTDVTFYFVEGTNVVSTLEVSADMSQGTGFISGWEIKA